MNNQNPTFFELLSEELKDLILEHASQSSDYTLLVKWSVLRRCNETTWQRACMTREWIDKPQHFSWRIWYARKCKPDWANRIDAELVNASEHGDLEMVRLFLDRGANIHAQDDWALRNAIYKGHLDVVRFLLDHGANIHAQDDYALRYASYNGNLELVRFLLDRGANIHADDDGTLRVASEFGYLDVVRFLLDRGANIHASNDWALRWASYSGHLKVVRLLLDRGANIRLLNCKARSLRWESKRNRLVHIP